MFGFLNVDKPAGITSRAVVNRIERLVRPIKVGHAGTLDPLATGVLVVALGPATRLIEYVQRLPKTYHGAFLLGRQSDTEDVEGTVIEIAGPNTPRREDIEAALPIFVGTINQTPPAFSAIKVAGQRAYAMARRGQVVELQPRPVEVYSLEAVRYEYPSLELLIRCGSGTYIRSLGRDLATSLGTAAVMSQLRRTAIGPFCVENATGLEDLANSQAIAERLIAPLVSLGTMQRLVVSPQEAKGLIQGQGIDATGDNSSSAPTSPGNTEVAAITESGELIAILKCENGSLAPTKCFISG